ncbi:MAG: AbrB/MazE/SpoVT family DNA-binding domain-containing protein [Candidatus Bathyarchaeota archaeon]|nr:AbrB/MazE/SpoVT family DNA-binding domain-containing protein [Candidatus Bathyarchaeota archaeon]
MQMVTVTAKGQITIPSELRKALGITEGANLIIVREGESLKIIPVPKLSKLAGIDKEIFRGRKPSKEVEETRREWNEQFERRLKRP